MLGYAAQSELHSLWLGQNKTSLLTFTPCDLLKLIRGRTVWLSGDSQQQARWPTSCSGGMCIKTRFGFKSGTGICEVDVCLDMEQCVHLTVKDYESERPELVTSQGLAG